jgi:predicted RNA-binding protein with PUA-like domain
MDGGWLFKQEPECYSFADLQKDGETVWDGVTNALARLNLRKIQAGARVLYYHTGKERAIVGEAVAISGPLTDPASDDPKAVAVRLRAAKAWPAPLSLKRIKTEKALAGWDLVRLSRLSIVPVSPEEWRVLEALAAESLPEGRP